MGYIFENKLYLQTKVQHWHRLCTSSLNRNREEMLCMKMLQTYAITRRNSSSRNKTEDNISEWITHWQNKYYITDACQVLKLHLKISIYSKYKTIKRHHRPAKSSPHVKASLLNNCIYFPPQCATLPSMMSIV